MSLPVGCAPHTADLDAESVIFSSACPAKPWRSIGPPAVEFIPENYSLDLLQGTRNPFFFPGCAAYFFAILTVSSTLESFFV